MGAMIPTFAVWNRFDGREEVNYTPVVQKEPL